MDEHLNEYVCKFLTKVVTSNDVTRFKKLQNYEERFILGLEIILRGSTVLFDFECKQKSSEYSITLGEEGNYSYECNKYYKAVQEYTESIMHAVDLSEELAVAYANRSAALFKLKKYADCVADIDRALCLKIPDKSKTKLHKRKGLCLMSLGRPGAHFAFQEALNCLNELTLSETNMNKCQRELRNLIPTIYAVVEPEVPEEQLLKLETLQPGKTISCATDAVAITYSEKFGRHLVARRKIKPGELLIAEKPFCRRLLPKHIYTHCSYCLQAAWSMIPCKFCVNAAYCSENCKATAWYEYHEVECPVMGMLLRLQISDPICLSMRMAIVATQKGKKLDELKQDLIIIEQNTDPITSLYCNDGKFRSNEYRSIHCKEINKLDEHSAQKVLSTALWIAMTVCVLATQSEIFGKKLALKTLAKNPDVAFVGGLMLKHVHIGAPIKTHKVIIQRGRHQDEYGHSLMGLCSLLNHSCDANTIKRWHVDRMARYAAYPIEKGEQIFDNYESHFSTMMKSERQKRFKRWNFTCECLPCTEGWPLLSRLHSYKERPLTRPNKLYLDEVVQKFKLDEPLLHNPRTPRLLNELVKMIELLFTMVQKPCKELVQAVMMLKLFFATDETIWEFETVGQSDNES